jgi:transcriptional regulator with GAF, ATPase, and Fis domain
MPDTPAPGSLDAALTAIARAIAESLDVQEIWGRVADACRTVVPFDGMGVSLFGRDGTVHVHSVSGGPAAQAFAPLTFTHADFSPRLWPAEDAWPSPGFIVSDLQRELDPAYAVDRTLLENGFRSLMRLRLGPEGADLGSLILGSRVPGHFNDGHRRALSLVVELLTLAFSHEKLASAWRERRKRREALERLIQTLTDSLDVRAVFGRIAEIAQDIVTHDYLRLGLLNPDGRTVRILARVGVGGDVRELPEYPLPEAILHTVNWDYFIAREFTVIGPNSVRMELLNLPPLPPSIIDLTMDDFWMKMFTERGVRSTLRATIRLNGQPVGGLEFASREPDHFDDEDADFAMRLADHVALALAHHELAAETRRTAEARQRAAQLEERVQVLAEELETRSPHRALGRSRKWRDVLAQAAKVAPTDTTVLMTGESGTGKEVVARFIHRASARKDGPFVALNCAALPEQLLESELFGHEKGAFTGAVATRPGRIEQAAGGVLFLDEVGEMSPVVQAKFLRVLQEREFQRLGGTRTLRAEMRVLAATNRDLKACITAGTFREDLYYRLAVFDIALPPLRERPEDVLLLVDAFLDDIGRTIGRPAAGVSQEVRDKLLDYAWPGNVRELRNAIERAIILCEGGLITSEHLPIGIASAARPAAPAATRPAARTLDDAEREMVQDALARAGNNQSQAARLLGVSRAQLRSRMEKHRLTTRG